ncbi:exosortase-associated EpsI family protein [Chlorobium sp. N1]|uniref:exosortase-associated EpsI family protein n=1 Tax=Chlorobium sp. N1 TaxID=2491138 RepID=UPI0013F15882|nr:exosortase-associated EpsI family protein [Chlorobium sp. N1]
MQNKKETVLAVAFSLGLLIAIGLAAFEHVLDDGISTSGRGPGIERLVSTTPPGWVPVGGAVIDPDGLAAAERSYDRVVGQTYRNADGRVASVVMTWSADGARRKGHVQQVCYRGGGYDVGLSQPTEVSLGGARSLSGMAFRAEHHGENEEVFYWLVTGGEQEQGSDLVPNGGMRLRWRQVVAKVRYAVARIFHREIPDNLMVRVSCRVPPGRERCGAHLEFVREWIAALSPGDRELVLGR